MKCVIAALLVLVAVVNPAAVPQPRVPVTYKTCPAAKGVVSGVDVAPCDNPARCSLKRGTTPAVSVNFTPNEDITKLTAIVSGILPGGIEVPFPLDNPDGCKNSGVTCPVKSGTAVGYKNAIYIDQSYPTYAVTVRWRLVDQNNQNVVCVLVPVQITA